MHRSESCKMMRCKGKIPKMEMPLIEVSRRENRNERVLETWVNPIQFSVLWVSIALWQRWINNNTNNTAIQFGWCVTQSVCMRCSQIEMTLPNIYLVTCVCECVCEFSEGRLHYSHVCGIEKYIYKLMRMCRRCSCTGQTNGFYTLAIAQHFVGRMHFVMCLANSICRMRKVFAVSQSIGK